MLMWNILHISGIVPGGIDGLRWIAASPAEFPASFLLRSRGTAPPSIRDLLVELLKAIFLREVER